MGLKSGTNTVRQSQWQIQIRRRNKKKKATISGPVIEENNENVVAEIEANENEEILRRKKSHRSFSEQKKKSYRSKNKQEKSEDKELKPAEVKDQNKIPDSINLETPDITGSKKRTKNENNQKTSYETKTRDNSEKPNFKSTKLNENKRRSGKITITQALGDDGGRQRSIASLRRRQEKENGKC